MIGMSRFGTSHEDPALAGGQVVVMVQVVRDRHRFFGAESAAFGEHPANVLQVLMKVLEALARVLPPRDQGLVRNVLGRHWHIDRVVGLWDGRRRHLLRNVDRGPGCRRRPGRPLIVPSSLCCQSRDLGI